MNIRDESSLINGWSKVFESNRELLSVISGKVVQERANHSVYPIEGEVFTAFRRISMSDVDAVVVGQDPYFNQKEAFGKLMPQAMGLSFSVPNGVGVPPSLKNIYKELARTQDDFVIPEHGDLTEWSSRVLMLNAVMTVRDGEPNSHKKLGWGKFTDSVIEELVKREKPMVFLAWGKNAHQICQKAEGTHHLVIRTSHPSPLGATKSGSDFEAFLGSNCFNKCNQFLVSNGIEPIIWKITKKNN